MYSVGTVYALWFFVSAIAFTCAYGAWTVSSSRSTLVRISLALFTLFNPWVYNQLVSGHLNMILAYGATLCALAEAKRNHTNDLRLSMFVILTYAQLQFFLVLMLCLVFYMIYTRKWLAFVTGVAISLPTAMGIYLNLHHLQLSTPYFLSWEVQQSVQWKSALLLNGYFTRYAEYFDGGLGLLQFVLLIVAFVGLPFIKGATRRAVVVFAGIVIIVANAPRAVPHLTAYLISHVPGILLYRELYDLLAYVALAYIIAFDAAIMKFSVIRGVLLIGATILAASWIQHPPAYFWMDRVKLPELNVVAPPASRFALLPFQQPLRLDDRGSGIDPDAYARGSIYPLNSYMYRYPQNAAFGNFLIHHTILELEHLGVGEILNRPWYRTDAGSLRGQGLRLPRETIQGAWHMTLHPVPLVSELPHAALATLPFPPGSDTIFYSDVAGLRHTALPVAWRALHPLNVFRPTHDLHDPSQGWTDTDVAFARKPRLAQGAGGIFTISKTALYKLPGHGPDILAYVHGQLLDERGRTIATNTRYYSWITVRNVRYLRCSGFCILIGEGERPLVGTNLEPAPQRELRAPFIAYTPWLYRVHTILPSAVLDLDSTYDPHWQAWNKWHRLVHFRIDGASNGWLLPRSTNQSTVWLVFVPALVQSFCEVLGYFWVLVLFLISLRQAVVKIHRKPTADNTG